MTKSLSSSAPVGAAVPALPVAYQSLPYTYGENGRVWSFATVEEQQAFAAQRARANQFQVWSLRIFGLTCLVLGVYLALKQR